MGVSSGTSVSNLTLLAHEDGGLSFDAVQGQTYHIVVEDMGGLTGAVTLKLQAPVIELPLLLSRNRSGKSFSVNLFRI